MNAVNWLLINIGEAVLSLWEGLKTLFGWLFDFLDALLNPILVPVLSVLNPICTAIGDGVYALLSPLPIWAGLTVLSIVAGAVMLIAFRYTSNQGAIARIKDDIKANLLALRLYKDEIRVTFRAQARLLWAIVRLQRYMLPPVLIMLLPMLLGLAQMGVHHQWRPLRPGERTLITLRVNDATDFTDDPTLESSPGLVIEAGPVPGNGEIVWRVRGHEPGRHTLRFHIGEKTVDKELIVDNKPQRVSAIRSNHRWTTMLLHPIESSIPADVQVRSIEILYPSIPSWVYGTDYWILYFFIVSMATALALAPVFKVRF